MIRDIENCREIHLGHGTVGLSVDTTGTVEVIHNKPFSPVGTAYNHNAWKAARKLKEKSVCLFFYGKEGIASIDILIEDLQKIKSRLLEVQGE